MVTIFVGKPENYDKIYGFLLEASGKDVLVVGCEHSFDKSGGDIINRINESLDPSHRGLILFREIPCIDLMEDGPILQEILADPDKAFNKAANN